MGRHAAALLAAALAATLAGSPAQQTGHDAAGAGASPHEKAGMSKLDYDLMDAVSEGETDEVQRLLADGANANALNTEGETPLHVSGIYHTSLTSKQGHAQVVRRHRTIPAFVVLAARATIRRAAWCSRASTIRGRARGAELPRLVCE